MVSTTLRKYLPLVGAICLLVFYSLSPGQETGNDGVADDEKLLRAADVPVEGKGLLDFLRGQVPTAGDQKEVETLFRQLDSASFKVRQAASIGLIAMGPKMVPVLKRLLQTGPPLEVRRRAEGCLLAVHKKYSPAVTAAAVRLVKARKPDGACAALLEFAPFAPDDMVAEEVLEAVTVVGVVEKKVEPVLERALRDPQVRRREIAALLVGRFGTPAQRKAVGELLDDKDLAVRFRAAQGLIGAGTREALPVLVESLRQGPEGLAELAEEILLQAAGTTAPKIRFAAERPERDKCHQAWKQWLQAHQANVDLSKVDIGMSAANTTVRAREAVRQMLDLSLKPDPEKLRALTELPFYMAGQQVITSRKEWDDHLKKTQNTKLPEGLKLKFQTGKVQKVTEYLEKAGPQEKEFLGKYPRSQVRVVLTSLEIDFMGQKGMSTTIKVFVRVHGARARIIGTGPPDQPTIKK